ncbi:hypothetical protein EK21DRAFT_91835 [Setomelanomma holmii]|uniref:Uncharacterized protein n=1 Tax=Setomelanomma holmii TaxID=210430 RepID=A0A9P4H4P4_9PLEO|nr:hypothetical protein EK21DRAFT_91835 [Setomelanomma holmii]
MGLFMRETAVSRTGHSVPSVGCWKTRGIVERARGAKPGRRALAGAWFEHYYYGVAHSIAWYNRSSPVSVSESSSDDESVDSLYAQDLPTSLAPRIAEPTPNTVDANEDDTTETRSASPESPPSTPSAEYQEIERIRSVTNKVLEEVLIQRDLAEKRHQIEKDAAFARQLAEIDGVEKAKTKGLCQYTGKWKPKSVVNGPGERVPRFERPFGQPHLKSAPKTLKGSVDNACSDADLSKRLREAETELLQDIKDLPRNRKNILAKPSVVLKYFPANIYRKLTPSMSSTLNALKMLERQSMPRRFDMTVMMSSTDPPSPPDHCPSRGRPGGPSRDAPSAEQDESTVLPGLRDNRLPSSSHMQEYLEPAAASVPANGAGVSTGNTDTYDNATSLENAPPNESQQAPASEASPSSYRSTPLLERGLRSSNPSPTDRTTTLNPSRVVPTNVDTPEPFNEPRSSTAVSNEPADTTGVNVSDLTAKLQGLSMRTDFHGVVQQSRFGSPDPAPHLEAPQPINPAAQPAVLAGIASPATSTPDPGPSRPAPPAPPRPEVHQVVGPFLAVQQGGPLDYARPSFRSSMARSPSANRIADAPPERPKPIIPVSFDQQPPCQTNARPRFRQSIFGTADRAADTPSEPTTEVPQEMQRRRSFNSRDENADNEVRERLFDDDEFRGRFDSVWPKRGSKGRKGNGRDDDRKESGAGRGSKGWKGPDDDRKGSGAGGMVGR